MDPIITAELIESTLAPSSDGKFLLAVLSVLAMIVLLMVALMSLTEKISLKYDPAEGGVPREGAVARRAHRLGPRRPRPGGHLRNPLDHLLPRLLHGPRPSGAR